MHFVIYGAGAVGGVIGGHLFRAGVPTTLVARGAHLAAIRDRGLVLDTAARTHTLEVPAVSGAADVAWTDDTVVLLCVKSQQTAAALDDLVEHAPPTTPIVSAQNGVANEREILRRFGHVYSLCVMLPARHLDPGVVVQRSAGAPGILDVGRFPSGVDDVAEAISTDLRAAGFVSQTRDEVMAWKYRKLIMNLVNGVDATFRRDGEAYRELVKRARAEGEAVLAAAAIDVVSDATDRERRGSHIDLRPEEAGAVSSSTWQSVTRGAGNVEIDYLAGEVVLLGRLHGVPTPVNELVQTETSRLVREQRPAGSLDAAEALRQLDV